ncbi:MAG: thioredoxin family protein [Candidatus Puniceispirillaceae bacterium]|jgi:peroxiredoxin
MLLDTPICDFGWKAPAFTLADPDGASHSLDALMGENGLLVAFICNHCPYVKAVIDRLVEDAAALREDGVNTVAIMPNDYATHPDDSPPNMREFAARHRFGFPYLVDETQDVARAWGAICTPDFFGLNAAGALQYRGRLDDAARGDASNRAAELLMAMRVVAQTGNGPADQTPSMGCSIKWK